MEKRNKSGFILSEQLVSEYQTTIQKVLETSSSLRHVVVFDQKQAGTSVTIGEKVCIDTMGDDQQSLVYSYQVQPMVEPRIFFDLSKEQLMMIEEENDYSDLFPLEEAVRQLIAYEEKVFYDGVSSLSLKGLYDVIETPELLTDGSPQSVIDTILQAAVILRKNAVGGPYKIILGHDLLMKTSQLVSGKTLASIIEDELEEQIEVSDHIQGGVLLPLHSEDLRINVGKEISVGVASVSAEAVKFFLTERFNADIIDPTAVVRIQLKK